MSRIITVLGVLVLVLAGGARDADACTCLRRGAPCEEYWRVAAVFAGRVESITRAQKPGGFLASRAVAFTVLEAFRGVDTPRVVVRTGSGGGDCGFQFKEGQEYLVYATRNDDTGELSTGICSRTRPMDDAAADLEYARAIRAGAPLLGRISGSVMRRDDSFAGMRSRAPEPLPDVTIRFEQDGVVMARATTDAYGGFSVSGLAAGKYRVVPELPDAYYSTVFPEQVTLVDERGCADVDVSAVYNGRVAGRVVAASGAPIAGLTVEVTTVANVTRPFRPPLRAVTGSDGRYEIVRVPPGTFVVGINTQSVRTGQAQRPRGPRLFHPGVEALSQATRVSVEPGARTSLDDLTVPRGLPFVSIVGVVMQADGTPAEGARVYLKGPDETGYILSEPVITDHGGRFVMAGVEGRDYRVFAERSRIPDRPGPIDTTDQVLVTATEGLPPVRLVLRRRY